MKLQELFTDWLIETPLMEMAFERKLVKLKIRELQLTLADHMLKIMAFDDQAKDHWINEVYGYLKLIARLSVKPGNKKLSFEDYYNMLWDEPYGHPGAVQDNLESMCNREYKNYKRSELSVEEIEQKLERLYGLICHELTTKKTSINIEHFLEIVL